MMSAPRAAEVIVVGAGVVGIATALQLRLAGMDVLLLDRDPPAAATSSGNAGAFAVSEVLPLAGPGILRQVPGWLLDPLGPLALRWSSLPGLLPWLTRFVLASRPARVTALSTQLAQLLGRVNADYAPLIAHCGLTDSWRRHGALALYPDAAALAADMADWQRRAALGVRWQPCAAAEVAALEPALLAPWQQGVRIADWSHVDDPYLFSLGLFQQFVREGGRFLQQPVASLLQQNGRAQGVCLDDGRRLPAAEVVIASGVWSDRFARQCRQPLPLAAERGYHLNLPHAGVALHHFLLNARDSFVILPLPDGGVRLAGTVELAHRDAAPDYRRSHLLLDKARAMLGELCTDGMTAWMGSRPSVPDSLPVIGPSSRLSHLYFACGHGHLGLTLAATTGAMLRDHLSGAAAIPEACWPGRF